MYVLVFMPVLKYMPGSVSVSVSVAVAVAVCTFGRP
jgi:hypothetical protein